MLDRTIAAVAEILGAFGLIHTPDGLRHPYDLDMSAKRALQVGERKAELVSTA